MTDSAARRPRGRPKVSDAIRKRNNVTTRMRDDLKSRIEQSADAQERSISEEIEARLQRSFAEDARLGVPALVELMDRVTAAFLRGGQAGAMACGHPEQPPAEWMNDLFCYRAAVYSAIDALAAAQPPGLKWPEDMPHDKQMEAERLYSFFANFEQRHPGSIKVTREGDEK
jgi:hypothetical protein